MSKPELHNRPINYGVELEFVFAFHEDELQLGTFEGRPNTLKKDMKYHEREQYPHFTRISPYSLPDHAYNSWGVLEAGYPTRNYPYDQQPQEIVKRKLDAKFPNLETLLRGTPTMAGKSKAGYEDYKKWIITSEPSVCGRGSNNLQAWLPDREIKPNEWDSYGIELVSRVLNTGDPTSKDEINAVLDGVKGAADDRYDAFITNQCGLHVHVEAPQDLRVLKELALLTIVYEEAISRLHPPCRSHGHDATYGNSDSNRLAFIFREIIPKNRNDLSNSDCSTVELRQEYTLPALRARIGHCKNKEELSQLMCWPLDGTPLTLNGNRNRIVNWTYLCRGPEYAQTIEFRQARGTLEPQEVHHWVDFCVGVVRLAEFYVNNPDHFPITSFRQERDGQGNIVPNNITPFGLMDQMGLSAEAKEFWWRKIVGYMHYSTNDKDDRTDNELPPEDDSTAEETEDDDSSDHGGSPSDSHRNTGAEGKPEINGVKPEINGVKPESGSHNGGTKPPTTNGATTDTASQLEAGQATGKTPTTPPTGNTTQQQEQTGTKPPTAPTVEDEVEKPSTTQKPPPTGNTTQQANQNTTKPPPPAPTVEDETPAEPSATHNPPPISTEPQYTEEDSLGPAGESLSPNKLHSPASSSGSKKSKSSTSDTKTQAPKSPPPSNPPSPDFGQSYIPPNDEQVIPDVDHDVLPSLAEIHAAAQGNAERDSGSGEGTSSDSFFSMLRFLEEADKKNLKRKSEEVEEGHDEEGEKKKKIVNTSC